MEDSVPDRLVPLITPTPPYTRSRAAAAAATIAYMPTHDAGEIDRDLDVSHLKSSLG